MILDCRNQKSKVEDYSNKMAQQEFARVEGQKLIIHNLLQDESKDSLADDVRVGLLACPKFLLPKYFYDELGSHLFDAICLLPEYYLTRAEEEILSRYADEIVSSIEGHKTLLELGSGSATKTRNIIEALLLKQNNLLFVPIDISLSALETSADALLQTYGDLSVEAYAADYYAGLNEISQTPRTSERILALFLGSNIGNFEIEEAIKFLRVLRKCLKAGDALLLGADLKKDKKVLEDAYDDPLGLTAVFNLNQLARINRELDANFNLRAFRHRTFYNEDKGRIEIYIESLREQTVVIRKLDLQIKFNKGEMMHTENSCKYDLDLLSWLAKETGFERKKTWMDEEERFSSNLFFAV